MGFRHWYALARLAHSRPLLISSANGHGPFRQAGSVQGCVEVLHDWPGTNGTNGTNGDSPTQAKMLRRASTAVLQAGRG
jgi:hypothetical protein